MSAQVIAFISLGVIALGVLMFVAGWSEGYFFAMRKVEKWINKAKGKP